MSRNRGHAFNVPAESLYLANWTWGFFHLKGKRSGKCGLKCAPADGELLAMVFSYVASTHSAKFNHHKRCDVQRTEEKGRTEGKALGSLTCCALCRLTLHFC